jgi:hypothetical protein
LSKWASAASLDVLSSFCARSRRNRNAKATPQALESVTIPRGFLGLLAILGNESLVISNQTGDLLLLNHERLPQDSYLLLHLVDLSLMADQILVSLLFHGGAIV